MARYGYEISVSGSRTAVVPSSGGGGDGFPNVAGTASIVIGNSDAFSNGTYARIGTGANPLSDWILTGYVYRKPDSYFISEGRILFAPNSVIKDSGGEGTPQLGTPYSSWAFIYISYDSENDAWNPQTIATNSSTNASTIPTTGWSPAITITAA